MSAENLQEGEEMSPEQFMSAVFANMVIQNANMAMMFLGKVPHPQTGQPVRDLESAQMFIDQLEMLGVKTKGNLNAEEKQLLQQSLISLRLAFVEELRKAGIPVPDHLSGAVDEAKAMMKEAAAAKAAAPSAPANPPPAPAASPAPNPPVERAAPAPAAAPTPAPEEESRKRFSKKY